jgi:hypothetical protein
MSKMMWKSRLSVALPFVVGVLLLLTSSARAAGENPAAKAKEKAARKACLAGDPATGVALLAELFLDTSDFNYIFNQARCFEQNHRYEDAISHFREFLKKAPNLSKDDRADIEKQIAECQGFLQPAAGAPAPAAAALAPQPAPAVAPTAAPPGSLPVAPAGGGAATAPPSSTGATASAALDFSLRPEAAAKDHGSFYQTWWFWTAVGVVAAGTATVAVIMVRRDPTKIPTSTLGSQKAMP